MKLSSLLLFSTMFMVITSCGSGGGSGKRILVEHDPCHEDNKNLTPVTKPDQKQSFYNIITPIANLDRALDLAPKKDNQKIKIPEAQGKIIKDIRDRCNIQSADIGGDYSYQTFKGQKTTAGKAEDIVCPVQLEQKVVPDKTLPALVDTVLKEVKSHVGLAWKKDPRSDYKDLGPLKSVAISGEAKTEWLKNSSNEVKVSEKFDLKVEVTDKEPLIGAQKVCRKFFSTREARYEMAVVRVELKVEDVLIQGKYLTVNKSVLDAKSGEWEVTRDLRNDFYLNNVLIKADEIGALEKKRKETAGL